MKTTHLGILFTLLAIDSALCQEPMGRWDFTVQADLIRDQSGQGNDLRMEGCRWVASKRGKALYLAPESGRVWCPTPGAALRPVENVTVIAWIRPLEHAPYRWIVDHGRGWGDANTGYRLGLHENRLRFMLNADRVVNLTGGEIVDGQWHQVGATYDGREVKLFINGELVAHQPASGPVGYSDDKSKFNVGFNENGALCGEIASLCVYDRALAEVAIAADWDAGQTLLLTPEEITAQRYAELEKCRLTTVPDAPFCRDRHTTLLAHLDGKENCDADYSRWEGRAGGGTVNRGVAGRFNQAVELPGEGAPILYRGAGNCSLRNGTAEFWIRFPSEADLFSDRQDRYLMTLLPEWHVGYGHRPSLHLVLRIQAATRSLEFAAHTSPIPWYSHLSGETIADTAQAVLTMPLDALSGDGWHHVVCSWSTQAERRIWLLVDGDGVTATLAGSAAAEPPIPCYKIFLGGSYFSDVFCPTARASFDEFRLSDVSVGNRLAGATAVPAPLAPIDEKLMMEGEDGCRHLLDMTAGLQMGGGWEGPYTWPNLMPDESPGSYAAAAEDEYTMRHVAPAFLRAYEVLGEDRYLRVAENCGQMLVKTQDEHGAWCQGYIIMPEGIYPVAPGHAAIEEGTQTDPLRLLFWLWRVTGRQEYFKAACRSAEFVLAAQKSDGSWPLAFNSASMKPAGGYPSLGSLNDGATLWGMKAMLMGWHLTGEQQYLDSLQKAAEWVIRVQLPGKTGGWAEQYEDDGKPAWARNFEPPTTCLTAVTNAADILTLMYDLTADDRYLAPIRRCLEWGLSLPDEHRGYLYYDPETGQPMAASDYRLYRLGDAGFEAAVKYRSAPTYFSRLEELLKARAKGPLVPGGPGEIPRSEFEKQPLGPKSVTVSLDSRHAAARQAARELAAFRRGERASGVLADSPRHGLMFFPGRGTPHVQAILDYLLAAMVLAGETEAGRLPRYSDQYLGYIDPGRDWYKTPLGTDQDQE